MEQHDTIKGCRFNMIGILLAFVGMRRLERPTPTSLTWCANQLRHIPNGSAIIVIILATDTFFLIFFQNTHGSLNITN